MAAEFKSSNEFLEKVGAEKLIRVIKHVDENHDKAFVKHMAELESKQAQAAYLLSTKHRKQVAEWNLSELKRFVRLYETREQGEDLFENIISETKREKV